MMTGDGVHVSIGNPAVEVLADPDGACCWGAAVYGPDRCTCWAETYTLEQAPPDEDAPIRVRSKMCADCACRAGSPERNGDARYGHSGEGELVEILEGDRPFWCHDGMRAVAGYAKRDDPDGFVATIPDLNRIAAEHGKTGPPFPLAEDHYRPPVVDGVPFQADGSPGLVCAGWAAYRRAHGLPLVVIDDESPGGG